MAKKKSKDQVAGSDDESREEFLRELDKLSNKFGWKIWGCGCCGSPGLAKIEKNDLGGSYSISANGDDLTYGS